MTLEKQSKEKSESNPSPIATTAISDGDILIDADLMLDATKATAIDPTGAQKERTSTGDEHINRPPGGQRGSIDHPTYTEVNRSINSSAKNSPDIPLVASNDQTVRATSPQPPEGDTVDKAVDATAESVTLNSATTSPITPSDADQLIDKEYLLTNEIPTNDSIVSQSTSTSVAQIEKTGSHNSSSGNLQSESLNQTAREFSRATGKHEERASIVVQNLPTTTQARHSNSTSPAMADRKTTTAPSTRLNESVDDSSADGGYVVQPQYPRTIEANPKPAPKGPPSGLEVNVPEKATITTEGELTDSLNGTIVDRSANASDEVVDGSESTPDKVDLVPGGGLRAHEGLDGGHTIERHVGKTDDYLSDRMNKKAQMKNASAFTDRASAETGINENIRSNKAKIDSWLAGKLPELVIRTKMSGLGRVMDRAGNVTDHKSVLTVLRRSPALGIGYRIHTSYLELK